MKNLLELSSHKPTIKRSGSQIKLLNNLSSFNHSIDEYKQSLSPQSSVSQIKPNYARSIRNLKLKPSDEFAYDDSASTTVSSSCLSCTTSLPALSKRRVVSNSPAPHELSKPQKKQFEVGNLYGLQPHVRNVLKEE
jgi:hypothetical protein